MRNPAIQIASRNASGLSTIQVPEIKVEEEHEPWDNSEMNVTGTISVVDSTFLQLNETQRSQ